MSTDFNLMISITIIALITWLTRVIPFLLFGNRELPGLVKYLGNVLPPAIMVILVCYCLRNINFTGVPGCLPELISCAVVTAVHLIKKNMYLSIIIGTVCYMIVIKLSIYNLLFQF